MTNIEREEFKKIIASLVRKDKEGKSYIDVDDFNSLYFTDENRKEIIESLAERNIELRKVKKEKSKKKDDEIEPIFIPSAIDKRRFSYIHAFYDKIKLLKKELGEETPVIELAEKLEVCPERIEETIFFVERCSNIANYEELEDLVDTGIRGSFVGQESYEEDPYASIYRKEIRKIVVDYLNATFEPIEAAVYKYCYGLADGVTHTISETAESFGLSNHDIITIIFKVNKKVKKLLWDNNCNDYIYDLEVASQEKRI